MRVNPKYNNICWNRNLKCKGCSKEWECKCHYLNGRWHYYIRPEYRPKWNMEGNCQVKLRPKPGGLYDTL